MNLFDEIAKELITFILLTRLAITFARTNPGAYFTKRLSEPASSSKHGYVTTFAQRSGVLLLPHALSWGEGKDE